MTDIPIVKKMPKGSTCSRCGENVKTVEVIHVEGVALGEAFTSRPCGHTDPVLVDNPPATW